MVSNLKSQVTIFRYVRVSFLRHWICINLRRWIFAHDIENSYVSYMKRIMAFILLIVCLDTTMFRMLPSSMTPLVTAFILVCKLFSGDFKNYSSTWGAHLVHTCRDGFRSHQIPRVSLFPLLSTHWRAMIQSWFRNERKYNWVIESIS